MEVTPEIKNLIESNPTIEAIQAQAEKDGMITMLEDGFITAINGTTSLEEIFRVITE